MNFWQKLGLVGVAILLAITLLAFVTQGGDSGAGQANPAQQQEQGVPTPAPVQEKPAEDQPMFRI